MPSLLEEKRENPYVVSKITYNQETKNSTYEKTDKVDQTRSYKMSVNLQFCQDLDARGGRTRSHHTACLSFYSITNKHQISSRE